MNNLRIFINLAIAAAVVFLLGKTNIASAVEVNIGGVTSRYLNKEWGIGLKVEFLFPLVNKPGNKPSLINRIDIGPIFSYVWMFTNTTFGEYDAGKSGLYPYKTNKKYDVLDMSFLIRLHHPLMKEFFLIFGLNIGTKYHFGKLIWEWEEEEPSYEDLARCWGCGSTTNEGFAAHLGPLVGFRVLPFRTPLIITGEAFFLYCTDFGIGQAEDAWNIELPAWDFSFSLIIGYNF
jgi:hypothetical protein